MSRKSMIKNRSKQILTSLALLFCFLVLVVGISLPIARSIKPNDYAGVQIPELLIIDNVSLVTMTHQGILRDKQLVIQNGIIQTIQDAGSPFSNNAQYMDAKQGFLTPGLFDMHVHIYDSKYLVANLAFGVTSVRAMRGESRFLRWKNELANNQWLGSNLYVSSPILDGEYAHALNQKTLTPEEGRLEVRKAKQKGYDLIKAYGYLAPEVFAAIRDEAKKQSIPVAKHGPHPIADLDWTSIAGLQSLEHVEDIFQGPLNYKFDKQKLPHIIHQIKSLNTPVTPTLATFKHLTDISSEKQAFIDSIDLDYLNPFYRDLLKHFSVDRWLAASDKHAKYNRQEFEFLQYIVNELHKEKVSLLVGSDSGTMFSLPGISTHDEMNLMKQAGLSDYQVLKAATFNSAQALKVADKYGSIQTGMIADLLLVSGNPVENIGLLREPAAVIKSGQLLNSQQLQSLKQSAKNQTNYYFSVMALIDDIVERAFE